MTPAATLATDPDGSRPLIERQIAVAVELMDLGLEIAREIKRQAVTPGSDLSADQAVRAFDRISRAVRLSLLLQEKLIAALKTCQTAPHPEVVERTAAIRRIALRISDRNDVHRPRAERLITDRLDRDYLGDVLTRPVSEIIALICKDIGLKPDWPRLADEAWAKAELAAGEPGWPLRQDPPCPPRSRPPARSPRPPDAPPPVQGDCTSPGPCEAEPW